MVSYRRSRANGARRCFDSTMELYFKDLISEDATLEKLVDDLSLVVQGADDFASALEGQLPEESRLEVTSRLNRLKARCERLRHQAIAGAQATDKLLRKHPYLSLTLLFATGLFVGINMRRRR